MVSAAPVDTHDLALVEPACGALILDEPARGELAIVAVNPPQDPAILLRSKLLRPQIRAEQLWRQRLIDRLDECGGRPLTVVCAPPGFGKTTLAAQWATRAELPVAWLSLGTGDDDPATFLTYLVAAIQTVEPASVMTTQSYLEAPGRPSVQAALSILLNDLSLSTETRRIALVLDDYHTLGHPAIHAAVDFLVKNLPRRISLIILTRSEPLLPLARLRARDELLEIRAGDLRFTREEAGAYFDLLNERQLTLHDIDILTERSEGWITGLHLAALSIHGRPRTEIEGFIAEFSGSVRLVDDYLMDEALRSQPADLRSFMLRTSILERFTGELCDVVTGRVGGRESLRQLERANLFLVPLDEHRHWFRYHHLVAEFLRGRLQQQVNESEVLAGHRRAAAWFEAHGFAEEAASHALAGRDWERGLRTIESFAGDLVADDRLAALRSWLEALPPEVLDTRPTLAYWLAWALVRSGAFAAAQRPLLAAEQAWTAAGDHAALAAASNLYAWRCLVQDDPQGVIAHAGRALGALPEERRVDRMLATALLGAGQKRLGDLPVAEATLTAVRGMVDTTTPNWLQLFEASESGWILLRQGNVREAMSVFQQVIRLGEERCADILIRAHLGLAEIGRERNTLDQAEGELMRAEELARRANVRQHGAALSLALARIRWARGDAEGAFSRIHQAIGQATEHGNLQLTRSARAIEARFWIDRNELALARRWADESGIDPYLPAANPRQIELLTFVRLQIAQGHLSVALSLLDRLQRAAEEFGRLGELTEMYALRAIIVFERDGADAATPAIEQALRLAEAAGYVRSFVDHGARITPLLRFAAARTSYRDYANRLLATLAEGSVTAMPMSPVTGSLLSDRELEVLRLVAVGFSNRDVGDKLYISEGTVKKHLGSVMGKLMVVNRLQAVDQARKLGLL